MEPRQFQASVEAIHDAVSKVIVGKSEVIATCLVGLLAEGHLLLEDVPGMGKTTLAKALARTLGVSYKRIQFTPDLLPSDLTGTVIFDQHDNRFHFREGPVFANVVLADEINRATPKTQSALLECMEERQVTIDLQTHPLPEPFFVIATQNPTEYEGVYPLPESQLDRFAMRLSIGYPTAEAEKTLLRQQKIEHPLESLQPVADAARIQELQAHVRRIGIADAVYDYILRLADATRRHRDIALGLSPRGSLSLSRTAQSLAAMRGRDFVLPDDVKAVAPVVMSHRLLPHAEARGNPALADRVVEEILSSVPIESKTTRGAK
jgi:MoxR-like ATPase